MVTAMDAPIAPDMVRTKFIKPAADATSCGLTAPKAILFNGIKKNGTAKP